jgi:hypothetical protein
MLLANYEKEILLESKAVVCQLRMFEHFIVAANAA